MSLDHGSSTAQEEHTIMKQSRVITSTIALILAATLGLAGCSTDDDTEATGEPQPHNTGFNPFPDEGTPQQDDPADDESEDASDDDAAQDDQPEVLPGVEMRAWNTGDAQPPAEDEVTRPTNEEVYALEDVTPKGMDPQELVITASNIMTTWIANEDFSETDGYRRALNLFVDDFDEYFTPPQNPSYTYGWRKAFDHDAATHPWSVITDIYEEGDDFIEMRVITQPTWVSEEGWTLRDDERQWVFHVGRDGDDWIIKNFTEGGFQ